MEWMPAAAAIITPMIPDHQKETVESVRIQRRCRRSISNISISISSSSSVGRTRVPNRTLVYILGWTMVMVLPVAHAHGTYAGAGVGGVTCAFASPSSRSTTNKNNVVTMKGNLPVALSLSAVWGKNGFFSFPISKTKSTKQQDDDEEQRETLKQALLRECCRPDSASFSREVVEAAIGALAAYTPIVETAASPVLQQPWQLVWTTEKEINFFLDRGWSTNVTQCITNNNHDNKEWNENDNNNDSDSTGTLVNAIPFVNNRGSLEVVGRLFRNINEDPVVRTRFVFETATVTLGNWISIPLPPVGQGWFDTVYLDDTFRVDMNSRNDILICRSFPP